MKVNKRPWFNTRLFQVELARLAALRKFKRDYIVYDCMAIRKA